MSSLADAAAGVRIIAGRRRPQGHGRHAAVADSFSRVSIRATESRGLRSSGLSCKTGVRGDFECAVIEEKSYGETASAIRDVTGRIGPERIASAS